MRDSRPPESDPVDVLLRERTRSGVRWSVVGRLVVQVVSLGYAVVLARLLTPDDFGTYGIALVLIQLVLFADAFRLEAALIQSKDTTEGALSAAAVFAAGFGIVASLVVILLAATLGDFFRLSSAAPLLVAMSGVYVLRSLFIVNRVLIRRRLLFGALVAIDVAKVAIGGVVAIILAARGAGAWALVGYFLSRVFVEMAGSMIAAPWRPRAWPDVRSLPALLRFGLPSSASELLVYAQLNLTDLFVGRYLGAAALGLYQQAFALMSKPVSYFDDVVNRLAFPLMARKWHASGNLASAYARSFAIVTAAAAPGATATAVLAPELIRVVYGPQWTGAIAILEVLAPLALLKVWQPVISAVFHARGRPMIEFVVNAVVVVLLALLLWASRGAPASTAALATVAAFAAAALAGHTIVTRWLGLRQGAALRMLAGPAVACAGMAAAGMAARQLLSKGGDLVVLVCAAVGMTAVYAVVLRAINRGLFEDAVSWVAHRRRSEVHV